MRIGIAVPTLNAGSTIRWTLLSLQQQMGCEVDVAVVDSGSTDATLSACASVGIRVLFEPPGNLYRAVNTGLRSLQCTWLSYLNADDVAYSDAYATLVAAGEKSGADVVYGDCDQIDWHGRFLFSVKAAPPHLLRSLYLTGVMPFNQPCAVFRRELFERLGGFNEQYRQIADFDFFRRAFITGAQFERVRNFSVAAFRLHPAQFSARERSLFYAEHADADAAFRPRMQWSDRFAGLRWRITNAEQYVVRRIRTGQWSDRP